MFLQIKLEHVLGFSYEEFMLFMFFLFFFFVRERASAVGLQKRRLCRHAPSALSHYRRAMGSDKYPAVDPLQPPPL